MSIFNNFQSKLINLDYLLEASDNDEDFMKMMIMSFINNHLNFIKEIKQSLNDKNYADLYAVAHKFRGAATIIGIKKLQDNLLFLEKHATEKTEIDTNNLIKDIEKVSENACQELQDFMVAENIW